MEEKIVRQPAHWSFTSAALLVCALFGAEPACAATQVATVSAQVVKPLTLKWLQDLDLGTVTLGSGTWSSATVGISHTGLLTCPSAQLICSGSTAVAKYNVTGSNNQIVRIAAPNVTLVNQSNASQTLTLVVDNPGTVTLTSSGAPGNDFQLGGSITLSSSTADGTYAGTFNVTVDYQ